MEITHIIINEDLIYIFAINDENKIELIVCDIFNFFIIKNTMRNDDLLELYMNGILLHNNKFYFIGGYDRNFRIPNSFENIIVTDDNLNIVDIIKTNPLFTNNYPVERLFMYNNNFIIKDDVLYMCGGVINDEYTIYFEDYISQDFWELNLETKNWNLITNNIFHFVKNEEKNINNDDLFDYLEIIDYGENIIIWGKYNTFILYLYDIKNKELKKMNIVENIRKNIPFNHNFLIHALHYDNNKQNIYFIISSNIGSIYSIQFNVSENDYKILYLCNEKYYEYQYEYEYYIMFYKNKVYFFNKDKIQNKVYSLKNSVIYYNYNNSLYDLLANFIRYNDDILLCMEKNINHIPKHIFNDI
jgi:hypothetical protein